MCCMDKHSRRLPLAQAGGAGPIGNNKQVEQGTNWSLVLQPPPLPRSGPPLLRSGPPLPRSGPTPPN